MSRALVVVWLVAEALTYVAVLANSVLAALLIGILSTALGIMGLRLVGRRLGQDATAALFHGRTVSNIGSLPVSAIGSILLIAPGFLSDFVGLALLAYGVRSLVSTPPHPTDTQSLDLEPGEWTRLPDDDRRR